MSEPYLGMICIYPYTFAPRGWAFCAGQILPIAQNTALFSLLGTTFGGNGQTTFALPDLRSRLPIGAGQGTGLSSYALGQQAGTENATITVNQMPQHTHTFAPLCVDDDGTLTLTKGSAPANSPGATKIYGPGASATSAMVAGNTGIAGGSQPTPILNPYLALNFCIALEGIFPSRN